MVNATFHTSHTTDKFNGITWAKDLTSLVVNSALPVTDCTVGLIDRLRVMWSRA